MYEKASMHIYALWRKIQHEENQKTCPGKWRASYLCHYKAIYCLWLKAIFWNASAFIWNEDRKKMSVLKSRLMYEAEGKEKKEKCCVPSAEKLWRHAKAQRWHVHPVWWHMQAIPLLCIHAYEKLPEMKMPSKEKAKMSYLRMNTGKISSEERYGGLFRLGRGVRWRGHDGFDGQVARLTAERGGRRAAYTAAWRANKRKWMGQLSNSPCRLTMAAYIMYYIIFIIINEGVRRLERKEETICMTQAN